MAFVLFIHFQIKQTMKKQLLINDLKFWVDQNVIYCKVFNTFSDCNRPEDLDQIFNEAITKLSEGVHMPILFNLEALDFNNAVRVFKLLSKNRIIKSLTLSKTFLVNSFKLSVLLKVVSFFCNPAMPDLIFVDTTSAIKFCIEDNQAYNSIS